MQIHFPRSHSAGRFTFRYNGVFDWKEVYRESKAFWLRITSSDWDLVETLYKHKPSKLEVKWTVDQAYDAYYQINYKIWFKIIKPRIVWIEIDGEKKEMMRGNVRVWIDFGWTEDYENRSFAGQMHIFQSKWLRNIYRKVTWRERWDLVDDIAMFTATDFQELLGKLFNTEARGYASIWEPG